MQTILQTYKNIYDKYITKCTQNSIKPLSISLFRKKVDSQSKIIFDTNIKTFAPDFDAFDYLFDNNLHFLKIKPAKTGMQKRVTKASIAKMLDISRSVLNKKLLLAPKYPHIKRLKTLVEKSVREKELTKNDSVEMQKLAKIPINLVKKMATKKTKIKKKEIQIESIYEISQSLI